MANPICINENFSTAKHLTKEKPIIVSNTDDKFETILFLPNNVERKGEGGLREKGYLKKSSKNKPLISITTVVFNAKNDLEKTIQNIIHQSYDNVEFIIIDGGSTDGTVDVMRKYEEQIDYWVSEPDKGIYDAMNKGIDLAQGEWISFMNAGDVFYDANVLMNVSSHLDEDLLLVSGKVSVFYKDEFIEQYGNKNIIPHQAAFFKTKYMKELKFDLAYKILADGELLGRLQKLKEYRAKYLDIVIAKFYLGGVGNNPKFLFKRMKEELKIKSISGQGISLKWTLFQIYNLIGWVFYKVFGEYRYYTKFQKIILILIRKLK